MLGCGGDSGDRGSNDDDDESDERPRDAGAKKDGSVSANRTLGGRLGTGPAAPCSPDLPCTDAAAATSDAGVGNPGDGGSGSGADGGGSKTDGGTAPASDAGSTPTADAGGSSGDAGSTPPRDGGTSASDASTPAPDAGTTPATMCPAAATDDSCDRCLKGKCCPSLNACASDVDCLDLVLCMDDCVGDRYCYEACELVYPRAVSKYEAFSTCYDTTCEAACSISGG